MINNVSSVTLRNKQHSRHYISSVSTRQASIIIIILVSL